MQATMLNLQRPCGRKHVRPIHRDARRVHRHADHTDRHVQHLAARARSSVTTAAPKSDQTRARIAASPARTQDDDKLFTRPCHRRALILTAGGWSLSATEQQFRAAWAASTDGWYTVPATKDPKVIFVTGSNSGIGFAAVGKLAAAGHTVVLACRSQAKAVAACEALQVALQEQYGPLKGRVETAECDLSSAASIRACAEGWNATGRAIDVLALNAGAQFVGDKQPRRTQEGFELTVGANHLGHFLLANLLLPSVEASTRQPRVVITASEVHDPNSPGGQVGPGASLGDLSGLASGPRFDMVDGGAFDADKAYKDSKLCNILFARELSRKLAAAGSAVTVNAFGPGLVTRSAFFKGQTGFAIKAFDVITNDILGVAESLQGGGDCLAYMATDPSLNGRTGLYFNNELAGVPLINPGHKFTEKLPSPEAQDSDKAKRLWDLSAELVGISA